MDYQTAVTTQFIPRALAALNGIRNALIAAGLNANQVAVPTMPDTTDLRFLLTTSAFHGKSITCYIELTDASHAGGVRGTAIFTLWVAGNGVEITSSYLPGVANFYVTDEGVDALLAKLAELEGKIPEVAVKVRAYLGL